MENDRKFNFLLLKMDYEIIKKIGKGNLGTVYLIKCNHTNKLYALKVYKSGASIESLEKAVILSMELHHPNLMNCFNFFLEKNEIDISSINLCVVLEYIKGESLFKIVTNHSKNKTLHLMEKKMDIYIPQIISALKYLHSHKIVHRDIKPDNIIVYENEDKIKIVDYDFLIDISSRTLKSKVGTPYFLSPEIYNEKYYTSQTDLWSLGVTIYFCLTGLHPFTANSKENLKEIVISDIEPNYSIVPYKYVDIIKGLLHRNPDLRISLNNVLNLMR